MAQRQRQRVVGADAIVIVAEIGVADSTTGNLDDDLVGPRRDGIERDLDQWFALPGHHPSDWCCDIEFPAVLTFVNMIVFAPRAFLDFGQISGGLYGVNKYRNADYRNKYS